VTRVVRRPDVRHHGGGQVDLPRPRQLLAFVRLEDPPCLSPVTTVGRFDTVEAAQLATDGLGSEVTHADRQG
jgi:hypothetical protein